MNSAAKKNTVELKKPSTSNYSVIREEINSWPSWKREVYSQSSAQTVKEKTAK